MLRFIVKNHRFDFNSGLDRTDFVTLDAVNHELEEFLTRWWSLEGVEILADETTEQLDAQNPEGWITDRDPVKDGWYLVTIICDNTRISAERRWRNGSWECVGRVIAWMPRPRPFGGEHD